jgi:hypothetical protein
MGQVALILGVIALVLAGAALGIAFTNHGQTGSTGATGERGPAGANGSNGAPGTPGAAGPDATVNQTTQTNAIALGSSCTTDSEAQVGLKVSTAGTVVATAVVWVEFDHTAGDEMQVEVNLGENSTDCTSDFSLAYLSDTEPAGLVVQSFTLDRAFAITVAGSYTFNVNGELYYSSGTTDDVAIEKCTTVAVFYPS